jgi:two-component system NtrC family sensor kinase
MYLLVDKYGRTTLIRQRHQIKLLVIGTILMFLIGFILSSLMPYIFNVRYFPDLGAEIAVIQLIFVYNALIKYQPLSIQVRDIADEIFSSVKDGVIILDEYGIVTQLNPSAQAILSLDLENEEIFKIETLLPGFELNSNYYNTSFLTYNGANVTVSQSDLKTSSNQFGRIVIIKDVTEHIRTEKDKYEMQKRLFQASKLADIGELAAGVAHEINNPLMIMTGELSNITKFSSGSITGNSLVSLALNRIDQSIDKMSSIVKGLNIYARSDVDSIEPIVVDDLIKTSLDFVRSLYIKSDIDVKLFLNAGDTHVIANHRMLEQVIINLLTNAKDALGDCDDPTISIKTYRINDRLFIEVVDNGRGIAEKEIDKIFDSFYTTKDIGEGTGLGLYIAYSIIKSFNGEITVHSELGKGSVFKIQLPRGGTI